MNVVIIEDEQYTAEDLEKNIRNNLPGVVIQARLMSVKQALSYFETSPHPDLFFSDIQLGDGLSFEIFKAISTSAPVIFITAYDEYALKAFKANGIDYILKPFDARAISVSLARLKTLTTARFENNKMNELLTYLQVNQKQTTILVYQKDKIIPVNGSDIALFYTESELVKVICFDSKHYTASITLDELTKTMGTDFYRANRQFIVNRKAIKDVSHYFGRKLSINLTVDFAEKIIVSKEKSGVFLTWLSE